MDAVSLIPYIDKALQEVIHGQIIIQGEISPEKLQKPRQVPFSLLHILAHFYTLTFNIF